MSISNNQVACERAIAILIMKAKNTKMRKITFAGVWGRRGIDDDAIDMVVEIALLIFDYHHYHQHNPNPNFSQSNDIKIFVSLYKIGINKRAGFYISYSGYH